jgi:hypothetical protein
LVDEGSHNIQNMLSCIITPASISLVQMDYQHLSLMLPEVSTDVFIINQDNNSLMAIQLLELR